MKRKIAIILLSVISVFCITAMSACSLLEDFFNFGGEHAHEYRWVDNGDGTHSLHCPVSGCSQPDIDEGSHVYGADGTCVCGVQEESTEHRHVLAAVPEIAATCTRGGNIAHYICSGCGELFSDESAETQVTPEDVATDKLAHKPDGSGVCSVCGNIDWTAAGIDILEMSGGKYGYDYLGTMEKGAARQSLYTAIDLEVKKLHGDVATDYGKDDYFAQIDFAELGLNGEDATAVWKTYRDDNPLYYWFANQIGLTSSALYLLVDEEYSAGSVRAECNQLVYKKIREYLTYAEAETSAYQITLAFHDKIIGAIDYAYDGKGMPETAHWAHSVMGVFEERGGVCESYARAFQLLLNIRGIENIFVTGTGITAGGGEAHAWNLVRLDDGQWYWYDLTWDDSRGYMWGVYYGYFCVNDRQGVEWLDGGNQYGTETGSGIGGSPSGCTTFTDTHIPYSSSGSGMDFMYELPARAQGVYQGVSGELRVRDTFEVGGFQYAVAGYGVVQVTKVPASGSVVIREEVRYLGVGYTVISIGAVGGTGLFGAGYIFGIGVTSVTIPSTVVLIWGLTFYDCPLDEITFGGTVGQWNEMQKMTLWKRGNATVTVRCTDGNTQA